VVIPFETFGGEIPRASAWELPNGAAQVAFNLDLAHGDIRGLRGNAFFANAIVAGPVRAVYTDDGVNFFAWPYEVYPVKSMVVQDANYRVYYTAMEPSGPIIKVARTSRADGSANPPPVIGTSIVGGNFQPPENSNPGSGNGLGPDSWILGVPAPALQGGTDPDTMFNDQLVATLVDKDAWPGIPRLQLRVTYFLEAPDGTIVASQDITNTESGVQPVTGTVFPQVLYTNPPNDNPAGRGNMIQDMLWSFNTSAPRPYKYYFFLPPAISSATIARTVTLTNTGTAPVIITFGGAFVPDPGAGGGGGSSGDEA
jgi:hypothetical protein